MDSSLVQEGDNNVDINCQAIDGKNTLHVMARVSFQAQATNKAPTHEKIICVREKILSYLGYVCHAVFQCTASVIRTPTGNSVFRCMPAAMNNCFNSFKTALSIHTCFCGRDIFNYVLFMTSYNTSYLGLRLVASNSLPEISRASSGMS